MPTRNMLDLSTGHIPQDVLIELNEGKNRFGNLRWEAHEYGFIMFVNPHANPEPWFKSIHDLALQEDAVLVNLDSDAAEDPRLGDISAD